MTIYKKCHALIVAESPKCGKTQVLLLTGLKKEKLKPLATIAIKHFSFLSMYIDTGKLQKLKRIMINPHHQLESYDPKQNP